MSSPKKGRPGEHAGLRHSVTTRPLRLVIDVTVTAKTDLIGLEKAVARHLEHIVGVSVLDVTYTAPENVLLRRTDPLGEASGI